MRSLWWSRRAIVLHLALVVSVPGFFLLGWWQLHRALSGNGLSWAYTFEWPFFAAYASWMWWRLVHEETAAHEPVATREEPAGAGGLAGFDPYDESDPELAAYNRYLAGLHGADRPNPS